MGPPGAKARLLLRCDAAPPLVASGSWSIAVVGVHGQYSVRADHEWVKARGQFDVDGKVARRRVTAVVKPRLTIKFRRRGGGGLSNVLSFWKYVGLFCELNAEEMTA